MKQYFKISYNLKSSKLVKLLLLAIAIRLLLLPLSFHSDLNNNLIWGIYANEFGLEGFYDYLNFGNYARPDYPPLSMIIFLFAEKVNLFIFSLVWKVNIAVDIFPSNVIPWLEANGFKVLIKLLGVLSDILIGLTLYYHTLDAHGKKKALKTAKLFLFNPAIIYISSSWGQLDPPISFLALLSILLMLNKSYLSSVLAFFTSIMIKATYIPLASILLIKYLSNKLSPAKILIIGTILASYIWLIGNTFTDGNAILWVINTYDRKILPGAITLPYINLNAFNFWGFLLGLDRINDSELLLGVSLNHWAYLVSGIFISTILLKYAQGKETFLTIVMLYFAIFMFFPRVHERYLYPVFVFYPLVLIKNPKLTRLFYISSLVFFLNLYHWWWFPHFSPLVSILETNIAERLLSLLNIIIFSKLLLYFVSRSNNESLNNNS